MLPFLFLSKRSVQSLQVNLPARFVFSLLSLTFRSGNLRADSTSHGIGTCTKSTKCIPWISATPSEVSSGSHAESMWWRHHARFGVRESTGSGMTSLGAFESLSCSESYQLLGYASLGGKDFYLFFVFWQRSAKKTCSVVRRDCRNSGRPAHQRSQQTLPSWWCRKLRCMLREIWYLSLQDKRLFAKDEKKWLGIVANCGTPF